jgi:hypothetical protein
MLWWLVGVPGPASDCLAALYEVARFYGLRGVAPAILLAAEPSRRATQTSVSSANNSNAQAFGLSWLATSAPPPHTLSVPDVLAAYMQRIDTGNAGASPSTAAPPQLDKRYRGMITAA